jgi:hypothetical protein
MDSTDASSTIFDLVFIAVLPSIFGSGRATLSSARRRSMTERTRQAPDHSRADTEF